MIRQALGMLFLFTGLVAVAVSAVAFAMQPAPAPVILALLGLGAAGIGIRLGMDWPHDGRGRHSTLAAGIAFVLFGAMALVGKLWFGWSPVSPTAFTADAVGRLAAQRFIGDVLAVLAVALAAGIAALFPRITSGRLWAPVSIAAFSLGLVMLLWSGVA